MAVLSLLHLSSFISNQSFYLPSAVASFPSRLSELSLGVVSSLHFAAIPTREMLIEGEGGVLLFTPRMNITQPCGSVQVDPRLMSERLTGRNMLSLRIMSCEVLVLASFPLAAVKASGSQRGRQPSWLPLLLSGSAAAMRRALQPCERPVAAQTRVTPAPGTVSDISRVSRLRSAHV